MVIHGADDRAGRCPRGWASCWHSRAVRWRQGTPGPGAGIRGSGVTLDGLLADEPGGDRGDLPAGRGRGDPAGPGARHGLAGAGTWRARALSRGARLLWQGKVIEPDQATAVNRFFGMRIIRGQLYQGPSWLDGAPALILDYSQTSRIYARNRDEIRQVAPGLFLGLMYDRTTAPPRLSMYFALEATE